MSSNGLEESFDDQEISENQSERKVELIKPQQEHKMSYEIPYMASEQQIQAIMDQADLNLTLVDLMSMDQSTYMKFCYSSDYSREQLKLIRLIRGRLKKRYSERNLDNFRQKAEIAAHVFGVHNGQITLETLQDELSQHGIELSAKILYSMTYERLQDLVKHSKKYTKEQKDVLKRCKEKISLLRYQNWNQAYEIAMKNTLDFQKHSKKSKEVRQKRLVAQKSSNKKPKKIISFKIPINASEDDMQSIFSDEGIPETLKEIMKMDKSAFFKYLYHGKHLSNPQKTLIRQAREKLIKRYWTHKSRLSQALSCDSSNLFDGIRRTPTQLRQALVENGITDMSLDDLVDMTTKEYLEFKKKAKRSKGYTDEQLKIMRNVRIRMLNLRKRNSLLLNVTDLYMENSTSPQPESPPRPKKTSRKFALAQKTKKTSYSITTRSRRSQSSATSETPNGIIKLENPAETTLETPKRRPMDILEERINQKIRKIKEEGPTIPRPGRLASTRSKNLSANLQELGKFVDLPKRESSNSSGIESRPSSSMPQTPNQCSTVVQIDGFDIIASSSSSGTVSGALIQATSTPKKTSVGVQTDVLHESTPTSEKVPPENSQLWILNIPGMNKKMFTKESHFYENHIFTYISKDQPDISSPIETYECVNCINTAHRYTSQEAQNFVMNSLKFVKVSEGKIIEGDYDGLGHVCVPLELIRKKYNMS